MDNIQIHTAIWRDIILFLSINIVHSFLTMGVPILLLLPLSWQALLPSEVPTHSPLPDKSHSSPPCQHTRTTHGSLLPSVVPVPPSSPEEHPTSPRRLHTVEAYEEAVGAPLSPLTDIHDYRHEDAMKLLHPTAAAAYRKNLPLPEEIHAPPPSLHTKDTYAEALRKMPPLPPTPSLCDTRHETAMKMLAPATAAAYRKNVMSANAVPCNAPSPAARLPPQDAEYISSEDEQNDQSSMGVAVGDLLSSQAAADLHASFEQAEERIIELDEDGKDLNKKRRMERRAARKARELKRQKEAHSDDEDDVCI